jgi:hypothetical protein
MDSAFSVPDNTCFYLYCCNLPGFMEFLLEFVYICNNYNIQNGKGLVLFLYWRRQEPADFS